MTLNSQPKVIMRQISRSRWEIRTDHGIVLRDEIMLGRIDEAEEYVKQYISSYPNWIYELKPLTEDL